MIISTIPTAHNQVIFPELRIGGGTQYKLKRPMFYFAFSPMPLIPLKYPAAQ
jgi:hypothetical protein